MADAVETITPAAEKRKVQIKLQTEEAWVRLEYDLFKTLLLNLMDNALKSGTDVVFVQGSCENEQYKITISYDNGNKYYVTGGLKVEGLGSTELNTYGDDTTTG